ncbi:MAG TPA: hypothetical protein PKI11_07445 [Candidatus Hydrogenedentes bacterium]|nr:hypothetical protein [Candidatus Hydrogenedentota bacterium]HNT88044.1 hypothetical protein [Candidatus Hydrogenedentota bacterium]
MKVAKWPDPVVAETRKWREGLLAEADYDLGRLAARLMESQLRHGDKLVSFEPETPDEKGSA